MEQKNIEKTSITLAEAIFWLVYLENNFKDHISQGTLNHYQSIFGLIHTIDNSNFDKSFEDLLIHHKENFWRKNSVSKKSLDEMTFLVYSNFISSYIDGLKKSYDAYFSATVLISEDTRRELQNNVIKKLNDLKDIHESVDRKISVLTSNKSSVLELFQYNNNIYAKIIDKNFEICNQEKIIEIYNTISKNLDEQQDSPMIINHVNDQKNINDFFEKLNSLNKKLNDKKIALPDNNKNLLKEFILFRSNAKNIDQKSLSEDSHCYHQGKIFVPLSLIKKEFVDQFSHEEILAILFQFLVANHGSGGGAALSAKELFEQVNEAFQRKLVVESENLENSQSNGSSLSISMNNGSQSASSRKNGNDNEGVFSKLSQKAITIFSQMTASNGQGSRFPKNRSLTQSL